MQTPLVRCGQCSRHFRSIDPRCPFCGDAPIILPVALVVVAGVVSTIGAGCKNQSNDGAAVSVYGPPPPTIVDAQSPEPQNLPDAQPGPDPQPMPDAQPPKADAGRKAAPLPAPVYGPPPRTQPR